MRLTIGKQYQIGVVHFEAHSEDNGYSNKALVEIRKTTIINNKVFSIHFFCLYQVRKNFNGSHLYFYAKILFSSILYPKTNMGKLFSSPFFFTQILFSLCFMCYQVGNQYHHSPSSLFYIIAQDVIQYYTYPLTFASYSIKHPQINI